MIVSTFSLTVFVCNPIRPGHLLKCSPEDLNIIAMDGRMREMKKEFMFRDEVGDE